MVSSVILYKNPSVLSSLDSRLKSESDPSKVAPAVHSINLRESYKVSKMSEMSNKEFVEITLRHSIRF